MSRAARRWRRAALAAAVLPWLGAARLHAAAGGGCSATAPPAARSWPAPLDRPVSLHARDVSLRSALDRLAAAAHVDLAYSADLLPLDRAVCVSRQGVPAGDVLAELLRGIAVEPVVAGPGHVVLTPVRAPALRGDTILHDVALDRIVVTGSPAGAPERSLPLAIEVLDRGRLAGLATGTLSQTLDAAVPGVWAWEQSPSSLMVRYANIRGASSFGVSYPKVYIDGVEVANPLLLSRFTTEAVERIEVIRGPQGAALYGTDAISGVINVVTRHEGADSGMGRVRIRSTVGPASTSFGPARLAQDHEVAMRFGTGVRSAGLTLAGGTAGEFIRGSFDRHFMATGTGRLVGTRFITTGTLLLSAENAGATASPILADSVPVQPDSLHRSQAFRRDQSAPQQTTTSTGTQSVRQYTLGVNTTFVPNDRWTHSLVVGVDGDRLRGVRAGLSGVPALDAALLEAADGGADRGTLRVSSVAKLPVGPRSAATLSFSGDQSILRQAFTRQAVVVTGGQASLPTTSYAGLPATVVEWQSNTGVVAQGSLAVRDALFLTAGVREERNEGLSGSGRLATLPLLGGALVGQRAGVTVKLRAAYGTGTRPPRTPARQTSWMGSHVQSTAAELSPERQTGVEGGVDVGFGRALTVKVTRFDQLATGLIQRVGLEPASDSVERAFEAGRRDDRGIAYQLQNVGSIRNRGWEMQAATDLRGLSLVGTFSTVDSRVRSLSSGYAGDLRPGDRMLQVPNWTAGLTASWTGAGWSGSVSGYRAGGWIDYDYIALARAAWDRRRSDHDFTGWRLRSYWRTYQGVTHLRASGTRELSRGFALLLSGDNLLNRQRGEPDNVTVIPGRTLQIGIRAQF
jgi:outer membrane receptor protein involved in Fe transport